MSFRGVVSTKEFRQEIRERILKDVHIIMTRNSPQDQLLASGELLVLLEISDGMAFNIRKELSKDKRCSKAFDRVIEMRHFDCDALKEINKRLPPR